ncbi:GntR family transcriptional regulator [Ammoniphilus sp. YIM 78166]|uniref:GntR family transcriptional regulator n=1 Tax=Ammoniphilus sp. YIM 78166 TaxID=1644106 RepID=UPI0010703517|nr:GntR family transcriptional regulator [Ammoniphilus sp. YIM 78166]
MIIKEKERGETTEFVYTLLKEMIFGWHLSPGQKINISLLGREINVSAIPLREALSRLHSENLVIFEPNKGYRVSDILDEVKMEQMLEARILLETYGVRNIIRFNRLNIVEELSRLTEKMMSIKIGASYREVLEFNHYDHQFHYTLVAEGGNSFITEAYQGMHCHLHIARFYHVRGEVDQREAAMEHWEIIEAIRTRDIYRAEEALANHILDAKGRLMEKYKRNKMNSLE